MCNVHSKMYNVKWILYIVHYTAMQEISRRERELLLEVDQLVEEAHSTLDGYNLQLTAISEQMTLKVSIPSILNM